MAITEEALDSLQVREAYGDQRLLGLMQYLSSKFATTENYAHSMFYRTSGETFKLDRQRQNTQLWSGYNDHKQSPTVQAQLGEEHQLQCSRSICPAVIALGNTFSAQANPVSAVSVLLTEGAVNCNIVAEVENEVPVQAKQKDEANEAASHE
eukprot:1947124-Amphidinium_carterae.1